MFLEIRWSHRRIKELQKGHELNFTHSSSSGDQHTHTHTHTHTHMQCQAICLPLKSMSAVNVPFSLLPAATPSWIRQGTGFIKGSHYNPLALINAH